MKIVKNNEKVYADLMISNGKIATLDERGTMAEAVAVKDGKILAVGSDEDIAKYKGPDTQAIDAGKRTVIPGLNDSHLHVIRGGLNYNMELRWDGVPSLADALRMLKEQARRTPPGQWVRVVGGWSEFQFAERRMPTLEEINEVAPDTPVFVLHLYCRAMLNKAALRACGYTKDTPNPPAGEIQHDSDGNPTGLLIARPNATILYATLAKGPKLPVEHQINSTRHFMRELNRLGLTSIIDAGGGYQNYPEDYEVIEELHKRGEMTVRICNGIFNHTSPCEFHQGKLLLHLTIPFEEKPKTNLPSDNLKYYRQRKQMTTRQLAEKLDIVPATVVMYENGKHPIPYDVAIKLADVLEIEASLLYDDFSRFLAVPYTEVLKSVRTALELSQKAFAEQVGIVPSYYYKIEEGNRRPSRKIYQKICATLEATNLQTSLLWEHPLQ